MDLAVRQMKIVRLQVASPSVVSILVAEHNLVTKANVESSLIVTPLCA